MQLHIYITGDPGKLDNFVLYTVIDKVMIGDGNTLSSRTKKCLASFKYEEESDFN